MWICRGNVSDLPCNQGRGAEVSVVLSVNQWKVLDKAGDPVTNATFAVDVAIQTGWKPPPPIWQPVGNVTQDPNNRSVYTLPLQDKSEYHIQTSAPDYVPLDGVYLSGYTSEVLLHHV
jgi:hypothetical protein